MKHKLTLTCIVLSILETIFLFIPYCLVREFWEYEESTVYHGVSGLTNKYPTNIFGVTTEIGRILAVILVISLIITIVGFSITYLNKTMENKRIINFMPFINLALLSTFAFYTNVIAENDHTFYRYEWSINWLFYFIIAIQIITCVFGLLIQFEKTNKPKAVPVKSEKSDSVENISNNLRQYKELFDSGIITEEEFIEKKKEILKL